MLASTRRVAAPPADLRHPHHLLPLLPSGPGGVCRLASRRDRRSHHEACPRHRRGRSNWRRGRDSNPRSGLTRLRTFQARSFNHSDTSPMFLIPLRTACAGRDGSAHPVPRPSRMLGTSLRLSQFVPDELVEPAKRFDPLTHFPGALLQPLGHLSNVSHPAAHCVRRAGWLGTSCASLGRPVRCHSPVRYSVAGRARILGTARSIHTRAIATPIAIERTVANALMCNGAGTVIGRGAQACTIRRRTGSARTLLVRPLSR